MHLFVRLCVVNTCRTFREDVVEDVSMGVVLRKLPVFQVLHSIFRLLNVTLLICNIKSVIE